MFCANCGFKFEGNFCPNCGTPAHATAAPAESIAVPDESAPTPVDPASSSLETASTVSAQPIECPAPPLGTYKLFSDTLIMEQDQLVIVGKRVKFKSYDVRIPYRGIQSARFSKAPLGGQLFICWYPKESIPNGLPESVHTHIFEFSPSKFKEFSSIAEFLNAVVQIYHPSRETHVPIKTTSQITREKIQENQAKGIVCCPKCGSTSLSAGKKGFSLGKAAVGAALTGGSIGYGLIAGSLGSGKTVITCLNCGHQWKA